MIKQIRLCSTGRRARGLLLIGLLLASGLARAGGPFTPFLNCVDDGGDPNATTLVAVIGYINMGPPFGTVIGSLNNFFFPDPVDRGQPSTFETGVFPEVFTADFDEVTTVVWLVNSQFVSFDRNSMRCEPPVLEDDLFEDGFEN